MAMRASAPSLSVTLRSMSSSGSSRPEATMFKRPGNASALAPWDPISSSSHPVGLWIRVGVRLGLSM
jgi:hypothetical protein